MKPKKARATALAPIGYWVDETVPDLSTLLAPHGIDADEFGAWLGPQLGVYRGSLSVKALLPTRSEELAAVQQLATDLAAVLAHLAPGRIPPVAASQLLLALHKAGGNWHEMAERVQADMVVMHWAAQHVAGKLEQQPAKRGRKANTARDALLSRVIDRVRQPGMDAAQARALSSRILEACRVETPESGDDETIKKAALRGRRGKK
jgi:hypothetical protein